MKVGDLVKDYCGVIGLIIRNKFVDTHSDLWIVQRWSGYIDELWEDELEVISESR